jgi:hypothetical protein
MQEMKNAYYILIGKAEGKRPIGDVGSHERIQVKWFLK